MCANFMYATRWVSDLPAVRDYRCQAMVEAAPFLLLQSATQAAIEQYAINYASQENISIGWGDILVNQAHPIPGGSGSETLATYQQKKLQLDAPYRRRVLQKLGGTFDSCRLVRFRSANVSIKH